MNYRVVKPTGWRRFLPWSKPRYELILTANHAHTLSDEFVTSDILRMFAEDPDDPRWPLYLAWIACSKLGRIEAHLASKAAQ